MKQNIFRKSASIQHLYGFKSRLSSKLFILSALGISDVHLACYNDIPWKCWYIAGEIPNTPGIQQTKQNQADFASHAFCKQILNGLIHASITHPSIPKFRSSPNHPWNTVHIFPPRAWGQRSYADVYVYVCLYKYICMCIYLYIYKLMCVYM